MEIEGGGGGVLSTEAYNTLRDGITVQIMRKPNPIIVVGEGPVTPLFCGGIH